MIATPLDPIDEKQTTPQNGSGGLTELFAVYR